MRITLHGLGHAAKAGMVLTIDGEPYRIEKVEGYMLTIQPLNWWQRLHRALIPFINRLRQWMTRDNLIQAALLTLSAIAIYLVALPDGDPLRRWGYPIGLAAQPLWFWSSWRARQWGVLVLTLFYTGVWHAGVMRHFL